MSKCLGRYTHTHTNTHTHTHTYTHTHAHTHTRTAPGLGFSFHTRMHAQSTHPKPYTTNRVLCVCILVRELNPKS